MKKKIVKHPNIYLALFICLVAVGVGSVVGLANRNSAEETTDFSRITVTWSIEDNQPLTDEANIGISGIADERIFEVPSTGHTLFIISILFLFIKLLMWFSGAYIKGRIKVISLLSI